MACQWKKEKGKFELAPVFCMKRGQGHYAEAGDRLAAVEAVTSKSQRSLTAIENLVGGSPCGKRAGEIWTLNVLRTLGANVPEARCI